MELLLRWGSHDVSFSMTKTQPTNRNETMNNEIEVKNVAILEGTNDFVDGDAVLAALANGVVEFVDA